MVRPVYEYAVDRDARGPTAIVLRVIHHGGPNATDAQRVRALAEVMIRGVVQTIRQVRPAWTAEQVLDNVEGFLAATNLVNGQQQLAESHMINPRDLTAGIFIGNKLHGAD